jgi:hypothetical protein
MDDSEHEKPDDAGDSDCSKDSSRALDHVIAVTEAGWRQLHAFFGGGPVVDGTDFASSCIECARHSK